LGFVVVVFGRGVDSTMLGPFVADVWTEEVVLTLDAEEVALTLDAEEVALTLDDEDVILTLDAENVGEEEGVLVNSDVV
jgi:hypothetical protein